MKMKNGTSRVAQTLLHARTRTARAAAFVLFSLALFAPTARAADVEASVNGTPLTALTTPDGKSYYSFTDTDHTGTLTLSGAAKLRVLVVGGGGGGGGTGGGGNYGAGGGGGAGGFVEVTNIFVKGSYDITVGGGGAGGVGDAKKPNQGESGNASSIVTNLVSTLKITAEGGGGGGADGIGSAPDARKGLAGGSGGGGSGSVSSNDSGLGGEGVLGQGCAGGTGALRRAGAGGGGASEKGGDVTADGSNGIAGAGGKGKMSDITGEEVWYAGGGGGGGRTAAAAADGGQGGGGNGKNGDGNPGVDGTGGGGGGAGGTSSKDGGTGGSGIVIVRVEYVMPEKPAETIEKKATGTKQVLLEGSEAYTITYQDGTTAIETNEIAVTKIGSYHYQVVLNEGYCWADGLAGEANVTVKITGEKVARPVSQTLAYAGAEQILYEAGDCYQIVYKDSSDTFVATNQIAATECGTYYYRVTPTLKYEWADGTTETMEYSFSIMPARPEASIKWEATGAEQVFLSGLNAYQIFYQDGLISHETNQIAAIDIGTYHYQVVLNEGYYWLDGSKDSVDVTFEITGKKIARPVPESFVYNGTEQVAYRASEEYTIFYQDGSINGVLTNQIAATEVGSYHFRVTPTAMYIWEDGSRETIDYYLTITAKDNEVTVTGDPSESSPKPGESLYIFNQDGSISFTRAVKARVLVVGGGGGGGGTGGGGNYGAGGGGGAGGFVEVTNIFVKGSYDITVGGGGAGGVGDAKKPNQGESGNASSIVTNLVSTLKITAEGGGGGGADGIESAPESRNGLAGGSGGGGSGNANNFGSGGTSTLGQGCDGGKGTLRRAGAGGGGAGEPGRAVMADPSNNSNGIAGKGGDGLKSDITGEAKWYAGGGGGGGRTAAAAADGGQGGGGNGKNGDGNPGVDGTGGGGGGAGGTSSKTGGTGGSGVVIVRILAEMPEKPVNRSFVYTGSEIVAYRASDAYTITYQDGTANGIETNKIAATNAGTYNYKVTLKPGWTWHDGSTSEVSCKLVIEKATFSVDSISLEGWQVGEEPNEVIVTTTPKNILSRDDYTILYKPLFAGDWTKTRPTEPGDYQVTIEIQASPNYFTPSTIPVADFSVWAWTDAPDPAYDIPALGYRASVTVPATGDSTGTQVVRFTLKDGAPDGFRYRYAQEVGSDLRFMDGAGEPCAYKFDGGWNADGETTVLVEVPAAGTTLTMFWGVLLGMEGEIPNSPTFGSVAPQVSQTVTLGPTHIRPNSTFKNRWVYEPTWIGPKEWVLGSTPSSLKISAGESAYGEAPAYAGALLLFDNSLGAIVTNDLPSAAGEYKASSFVAAGQEPGGEAGGTRRWGALDHPFGKIFIRAETPSSGLTGNAPDTTSAGRVLLANNFITGDDETTVLDQDYNNIDPADTAKCKNGSYWVHKDEVPALTSYSGVHKETAHDLVHTNGILEICGSDVIWRLEDVRIGTLYNGGFEAGINYLPAPGNPETASHLLMRNVMNASVTSPCYTNGIGTIYFDVVNSGVSSDEKGFTLVVEVATNLVDDAAAIPTDTYLESAAWKPVKMTPLSITGGTVTELAATNAFAPHIGGDGKSDQNFYRVYVTLNTAVPTRFRIRRDATASIGNVTPVDGITTLILLDNIIVSRSMMVVGMEAGGRFDQAKTGKEVLGWGGAWNTPYPSVTDTELKGRGQPTYRIPLDVKDFETNKLITSAKMFYRWRYLNQIVQSEWKSVPLDPANNFTSYQSLQLPPQVGDVEFFYELRLNIPYYKYYDYSGADVDLGGLYTENPTAPVTNRWSNLPENKGKTLPSLGSDWFIRLREGKSDYEAVNLVIKDDRDHPVHMELVDDHIWRGYLKTPTNKVGTIEYRFDLFNKQDTGATEFTPSTNYWNNGSELNLTPVSGKAEPCDESAWTPIQIDAATGYLLFQLDTSLRTLAIVHADYQNFNAWDDAKGEFFKGTSAAWEHKSGIVGTSSRKQEWTGDYQEYIAMPETNSNWKVPSVDWDDINDLGGRTAYKAFSSDMSLQWQIGPGMWVAQVYKDAAKGKKAGAALQMQGQGQGYIELTDRDYLPRGIGTVSFNARLGQSIAFTDFAYYDANDKMSMKDYTFTTRAAFDVENSSKFRGNASLSLIAYYRPGVGCYEFRVEQAEAEWSQTGEPSFKKKGQAWSLYRWRQDANGRMTATLLGSQTNKWNDLPLTSSLDGAYPALYISVENRADGSVLVSGGMRRAGFSAGLDIKNIDNAVDPDAAKFDSVYYHDKSDDKLRNGTYGVLSANCEGVFMQPYFLAQPVDLLAADENPKEQITLVEKKDLKLGSMTATSCQNQLVDEWWVMNNGRLDDFSENVNSKTLWGLRAAQNAKQTITLYMRPLAGGSWKPYKTLTVEGYGTVKASKEKTFNLAPYLPENHFIRLAVDGDLEDVRRDVVIDSFEVTQWTGADWDASANAVGTTIYNGALSLDNYVPTRKEGTATSSWGLTNFVFTKCLPVQEGLKMAAKRASLTDPISIRSPFMDNYQYGYDGKYYRGSGLGMISFEYEDADENVNLLLQIATNRVQVGDLDNLNKFDDSAWTTVTNFSFKGVSKDDLASGTRNHYLGLHGVTGLMRLVVATNVVAAAANSPDADYGSIVIKKIFCRDEPAIDIFSWWGWNMRTVTAEIPGTTPDGKRMNLPDLSGGAGKSGLSLALNNSVSDGIYEGENKELTEDDYKLHQPFVQTPTFTSNIVGSVTFKARNYDGDKTTAYVAVYGATSGNETHDPKWTLLTNMPVTATTYKTYTYTTEPGKKYSAFRLSVTGVKNITDNDEYSGYMQHGRIPGGGSSEPVRVLIDEVLVSEALRARMAFRNVGAFRSLMNNRTRVPNVPSRDEQPLCREAWGVQCEVYSAQLADEIDMTQEPEVWLHWYEGQAPWGFDNWKNDPRAKSARLDRADNEKTNLVYRSTYASKFSSTSKNVIQQSIAPGTIVQYVLEVRYWEKTSKGVASTNYLDSGSWARPEWYKPLDLNAGKEYFSAYSILDSVSPGWAWINEVNLYGTHNDEWENSEKNDQYVEIAVPQSADITDWSIRLLAPKEGDNRVYTNTIAYFGTGALPGTQAIPHPASNMVFRVIGSPLSHKAFRGLLDPAKGEIDAYWQFTEWDSNILFENGLIDWTYPIGLQLVRASGVVEHEILCMGTNWFGGGAYGDAFDPEESGKFLEEKMPGTKFTYMGEDNGGVGKSLSVLTSRGANPDDWSAAAKRTPGMINDGQEIVGEPPTPNGETIIIYANIDNEIGHLYQTVGDAVLTNTSQMIFLQRGSRTGTNITYTTDRWWALGSVTTNGVPLALPAAASGSRTYVVNVGRGVSNNVTVTASAKINDDLSNRYGLTDENPYTPAVLDWLMKGETIKGGFAYPDSDTVSLAEIWPLMSVPQSPLQMTLTQMYWLDMDPTIGNLVLRCGFKKAMEPTRVYLKGYEDEGLFENVRGVVSFYITNRVTGAAWTPYTLRGLAPGEHSDDPNRIGAWTSVTFKVVGILANNLGKVSNADDWVSLRWFTFHKNSFLPLTDPMYPACSFIEIIDPLSTQSPTYAFGWHDWAAANPDSGASVFYRFSLNERITPFGVEKLEETNHYEHATSP